MRSCCVPGCSSGQHAPRHAFPKNAERRTKWFQSLHMEPPQDEKEIKKLKICYRHFRQEDYSGSATHRVLLHFAVPFINEPQQELINNVHCSNHVEQHEEQETLHEHSSMILQDKHEKILAQHKQQLAQHEQQLAQHEQQLAQHEQQLAQHEQQLAQHEQQLAQHEQQLAQHDKIIRQQQRMENMKYVLKMQCKARCVRPYLEETTRKILLSPMAKKFYNKILKMKVARKQKKLKQIAIQKHKSKKQRR